MRFLILRDGVDQHIGNSKISLKSTKGSIRIAKRFALENKSEYGLS